MRVYQQGAISVSLKLTVQTCINCGVVFGVPDDLDAERQRDRAYFYCPSGHPQRYVGEREEDRLRKRVQELEHRNARLTGEVDQAYALASEEAKGRREAERERQRIERRVHNGVCPHCHRTFKQLAAHMASKHPADGMPPAPPPGMERCPECGRHFAAGRGLARHRVVHRRG